MLTIGVIGDFQPANETHTTISESLHHTCIPCMAQWIPTVEASETTLARFDGLWCAPGSPFQSLQGALAGIRFARENNIPFLGTCAGFQHAVLEFARNVLLVENASSGEYDPAASELFISRLSCSLVGREMTVRLASTSRAREAYGIDSAVEKYYCNFGLNPEYEPALQAGGLYISGRDAEGQARVIELPAHRFFVATLFVPQTSSVHTRPHPVITAFVRTAAQATRAAER